MPADNSNNQKTFLQQIQDAIDEIFESLRSEWNSFRENVNNPNSWNSSFRKESGEVMDYYLTPEQREQLKQMRPMRAALYRTGWVFLAMFEKLNPERRVLSIIGVLLILFSNQNNSFDVFGGLCLILVILLELKDKLVAHDELEEGRHIQEMLMPEGTPEVNGWSVWTFTRSANEVCGDLIDFLRMDDGRIGVAIADVAGKGLHAALLTTKLQATLRAIAFDRQPLSTLIEKVNTIFHRDSPSHLFASLFYIEFTENESAVRFVNAGHLPALVRKNGSIEETGKGDLALGLTRTAHFAEQSAELRSGDLILLYSDGVSEAKNGRGEFFGKDRLVKLLSASSGSAQQSGLSILREVDAFVGSTKPSDDLSMIILQRK